MATFKIKIQETLTKMVDIEAKDLAEAMERVGQMYDDAQIILDSSNWEKTSMSKVEGNETHTIENKNKESVE